MGRSGWSLVHRYHQPIHYSCLYISRESASAPCFYNFVHHGQFYLPIKPYTSPAKCHLVPSNTVWSVPLIDQQHVTIVWINMNPFTPEFCFRLEVIHLHTEHCTLYSVHRTLYAVYCSLYILSCTLYTIYCRACAFAL